MNLHIDGHHACLDGVPVPFTATELKIVELLLEHRGVVVTKRQILDRLYAGRREAEMKIIDVLVHHIRRKLGPEARGYVGTSWGRGYVLRDIAAANRVSGPEEWERLTGQPSSELVLSRTR